MSTQLRWVVPTIIAAGFGAAGCGTKHNPGLTGELPSNAVSWCNTVNPIMELYCTSCHATGLSGAARQGAPKSVELDTYADVRSHADRAVARMGANTMPPGGGVPADLVTRVAGWVAQGESECGSLVNDVVGPGAETVTEVAAETSPADTAGGGVTYCGWVKNFLDQNCVGCHSGATPSGNTRLDTFASAAAKASKSVTLLGADLMPPGGGIPAADKASFQAWVDGGTPDCPAADGVPSDVPQDVAPVDPGTWAPTCTSGQHWTAGTDVPDNQKAQMFPGENCVACHQSNGDAAVFPVMGTVMGAYHDEDNCYGVAGIDVEITDHVGTVHKMTTNTTGNFLLNQGNVVTPFKVRVVNGTVDRKMSLQQSNTNCMDCHTVAGLNHAPGRIVAP